MSASAIIMMCIACIGLWGGGIVSLLVMFQHSKKSPSEVLKEIEDAETEVPIE